MTIRRTYHLNTIQANRKDGIYISNFCDFHFRESAYTKAPYGIDSDSTGYLSIGDRLGYKPNSDSFPIDVIGGLHGYTRITAVNTAITVDDLFLQCSAVLTVTIPAISTMPRKIIIIENINSFSGTNIVSIVPTGADTIDGAAQIDLDPGAKIILYLDPTAGAARVISNTPRMLNFFNDYTPSLKSTTSATYVTMVTSPAFYFSGRPGLMQLNIGARDDNGGVDEYWRADFAIRFGSGSDRDICKCSGTFHDEPNMCTGTRYLFPSAGSQTVDIRWKRGFGAGTLKLDDWQYIQLRFMEL